MNKFDDAYERARKARAAGNYDRFKKAKNPYPAGSLEHYCYDAGHCQDVRSPDQLLADWLERQPR